MTNNTSTNLADVVMRRVHTIHTIRPLVSGAMLAFIIMAAALYGIGREVWVAKVFENAPTDLLAALQFFLTAFGHTQITVQAFTIIAAGAMLWFFKDVTRAAVQGLTHTVR